MLPGYSVHQSDRTVATETSNVGIIIGYKSYPY
jgi:hypothetical protein